MNQVKLVIWDLDETFWKGTLSEGEVKAPNASLVKKLTQYGIINSICSKNDFSQAKTMLEKMGVWEYFVFPVINWEPKGASVKGIIADCQLRATNVVFIDDNSTNIGEVSYYNEGIMTYSSVDAFEKEMDWSLYKADDNGKRLKQYKLLEEKKEYRSECTDNQDFLEKSNIRIQFIDNLAPVKERVVEMIGRTNQLNFTKLRVGMPELDAMLSDDDMDCKAIRVVDNFGDYGICGFYALKKSENKLLHYLFSCRILNLGVENYVYQKLGRPSLKIAPPISAQLDDNQKITWIKEIDVDKVSENKTSNKGKRIKIAMLGGCDLDQLVHYLSPDQFEVIKDFNYTGNQMQAIHREHTVFLKAAETFTDTQKSEIFKLPFLDEKALDYHTLTDEYDWLVFSPLMNYTQEIYRDRNTGVEVAYGGYVDITQKASVGGFTGDQLEYFKRNYELVGQQKTTDFYADLIWLISRVKKPIIFLNGAEVDVDNPHEIGATQRHREMNSVLKKFIGEHSDKCYLVDVNKYVKERTDIEDNIRHYKRVVYIELAKEIISICAPDKDVKIKSSAVVKMMLISYINKLKKVIVKLIGR